MADVKYYNNIDLLDQFKVIRSQNPTNPQDLVTLSFLESYVAGMRDPKDSVRVASTGNVALTGGASLTIDGVSLANGDSVLLKNQTIASQNGIYVVSGIGSAYTLTRRSDANSNEEVTTGMFVFVTEGTVNQRTGWVLTTADPITLGTTNLTFTQIYGANPLSPSAGIDITGNTISVKYDDVSINTNASDQIRIKPTWPGQTSIVTLGTVTTGTWNATTIGIAYGGTGATTAADARSNLSAAKSGSNSDITELTGLTVALSISQGGTGATTASGARNNIGATGKYVGTLASGNATYNVTHNLGTEDIHVSVWESTSKIKVEGVQATIIDSNTVQLAFGVNTTVNHKVVVIG